MRTPESVDPYAHVPSAPADSVRPERVGFDRHALLTEEGGLAPWASDGLDGTDIPVELREPGEGQEAAGEADERTPEEQLEDKIHEFSVLRRKNLQNEGKKFILRSRKGETEDGIVEESELFADISVLQQNLGEEGDAIVRRNKKAFGDSYDELVFTKPRTIDNESGLDMADIDHDGEKITELSALKELTGRTEELAPEEPETPEPDPQPEPEQEPEQEPEEPTEKSTKDKIKERAYNVVIRSTEFAQDHKREIAIAAGATAVTATLYTLYRQDKIPTEQIVDATKKGKEQIVKGAGVAKDKAVNAATTLKEKGQEKLAERRTTKVEHAVNDLVEEVQEATAPLVEEVEEVVVPLGAEAAEELRKGLRGHLKVTRERVTTAGKSKAEALRDSEHTEKAKRLGKRVVSVAAKARRK